MIARRLDILLALSIVPAAAIAQRPDSAPLSPTLAQLQRDAVTKGPGAVDAFWQSLAARGTPLIERPAGDTNHFLVSFVWKDAPDTRDVVLVSQVQGIEAFSDPRSHLRRLSGTNVWYGTFRVPNGAEFLYQFSLNPPVDAANQSAGVLRPTLHADPLDTVQYPSRIPGQAPGAHLSIARMPGVAPNSWIVTRPDVPAGAVHEHDFTSAALQGQRHVWVYTPPGGAGPSPNVLVMLDGRVYVDRIPAPVILDNLLADHKITPTIGVFVDNGGVARARDMSFNDAYVTFLANELLPWVQQQYAFKATPTRTAIGGSSLGGVAAVFAAMKRPDVFGEVISQSGAFWAANPREPDGEAEWLTRQLLTAPKANVAYCLEAGQMEFGLSLTTTLLAANRHLRDVLQAKGYQVRYFEVYGAHEPLHWGRTLPECLMTTFGGPR